MKKFTTKLLMSIIAVAFAFVALGTSTYAWFSMNTEVTVSGMKITAKSDSTYLIIGESDDKDVLQDTSTGNLKAVAFTDAEAAVYPSAHENVSTIDAAKTYANWYWKEADAPTASASSKTATPLTEANFTKYVIKKTVYVTLAKGSNEATNLVVTATFTADASDATAATIEPIKVLVVSSDNVAVELAATSSTATSSTALATTVTDQAAIQLDIYIYYDGNSSLVYTNNVANLNGAAVELAFSVTAAGQGN